MQARRVLTEAGAHLGAMIANFVTSTDPGNVLVPFVHSGWNEYAEPMNAAIHERTFDGFLPGPR